MSLVLKSNVIATVSLGNLNGINGSQDWLYFADLENLNILKKVPGSIDSKDATDLFANAGTLNMLAKPITMTKLGGESFISAATDLRFLLDKKTGRYGLAAESNARANFISLSTAPANQTVTVPASSAICASVVGTGSMTLTSANFDKAYVVTEDNPVSVMPVSTSVGFDISVTISGPLSHAQIERPSGLTSVASKISTPEAPAANNILRGLDQIQLKQSIVDELKSSNSDGITVLFQHIPYQLLDEVRTAVFVERRFEIVNSDTSRNTLMITAAKDRSFTTRQAQWSSANIETAAALGGGGNIAAGKGTVCAITVKAGSFLTSINGGNTATSALTTGIADINSMIFAPQPQSTHGGGSGGSGIITKVVLYKKAMTSTELKQLSASWL